MSFDDWTHEGKSAPVPSPPSSPPTPDLHLLNQAHRRVLDGDRRALWPQPVGLGCLLLFFLPFVLAGVYVPYSCLRGYLTERRIAAEPVPAVAQVVGTRVSRGDDHDSYYVRYRYLSHEREARVSPSEQTRAQERGKIDVVYCRSDPGLSRAVKESRVSVAFALTWTAIWDGSLLLFAGASFAGLGRTRKLIHYGQLVGGIVTGASTRRDSDDDCVLTLEYRFESPSGQVVDASFSQINNDYKTRPLPVAGTPVAVLYADGSTYQVL